MLSLIRNSLYGELKIHLGPHHQNHILHGTFTQYFEKENENFINNYL